MIFNTLISLLSFFLEFFFETTGSYIMKLYHDIWDENQFLSSPWSFNMQGPCS